ncbi:MAG: lysine transporter LysE [Planctomycetes bacterium]|nr:lysine transporter LysE [Planctomycetota bacterium]
MALHFFLGATYGFAAAVVPGPLAAYLISSALRHGWRRTAPATLSPLLTDGPIALLVLGLLTAVPPGLIQTLRLLGACFLGYLAADAFRASFRRDVASSGSPLSVGGSLTRAATVNLLNPNPYLGWSLVLGPLVLQGWSHAPATGVAVVVGFYATMIGTMLAWIAAVSAAGQRLGPRVNRILLSVSGAGLTAFAIYQLWLWWTE